MADAPPFDRALLREFALCFVDAAVTRLIEELMSEANCMNSQENPSGCANPGPALLDPATAGHGRAADTSPAAAAARTMPEVL